MALLTLAALCPATTALAQQPATAPVYVEVETDFAKYYRRQPIVVRVRIGVDARFASDHLVQQFRTPLDVPVQLDAAWLDGLEGTRPLPTAKANGPSIAAGGAIRRTRELPQQTRGGRTFRVLELEHRMRAGRIGELLLVAPQVRYVHAERFRDDLLTGRVPIGSKTSTVTGAVTKLEVAPLPTADRPAAFTGGVGRFAIQATAAPVDVETGSSVTLTVTIEGSGNFAELAPPDAPVDDALHVRGKIERRAANRLEVDYELAVTAPTDAIPAVEFAFFDVTAKGGPRYATARTRPIPLRVRGAAIRTGPELTPGVDDIHGLKDVQATGSTPPALLWALAGVLLPWLLGVALRSGWRAHRRARAPERVRERRAAQDFAAAIAADATRTDAALVEYLTVRLECSASAVLSHDLRDRLEAQGIGPELAQRTDDLVHALHAGRYGGDAHGDEHRAEALAIVLELEQA